MKLRKSNYNQNTIKFQEKIFYYKEANRFIFNKNFDNLSRKVLFSKKNLS